MNVNLFCLPFAGGSKYSYRYYEELAPPFLSIISLEYPGRGSRIREPFISNVDALVDDLYLQVESHLNTGPYAIYGHSLGGLLAYLLTKKIVIKKNIPPLHLFITGTCGPSAPSRENRWYHLLDAVTMLKL